MLRLPRWRVILVVTLSVLGLLFAMPNVLPQSVRDQIPPWLPHETLNLGLDLRGGSHLLLEIDARALQRQQLDGIAEQMGSALRDAEPAIRFTARGVVGDAARIRLVDPADMARALVAIRPVTRSQTTGNETMRVTQTADGAIEARYTESELRALSRDAVARSIEVLGKRVDPTGAAEVSIVRQGDDRIVVQAPGVSDPQVLRNRIGQTALMTFHMVREVSPQEAAAGQIPVGSMSVEPYAGMNQGRAEFVERRPRFTGERLANASVSTDQQTGEFVLAFALDNQGDRLFCRITREFTGQRFAILLDNQVLTAPTINEPICGGRGQISGNFTAESAAELALMLRAGALPVPLTVIEQRTVTAELGQDAIDSGTTAGIVAAALVVAFMVLAYGWFGVLACLALVINIAQIIAVMTLSGATLSLPGIAGLVLTMGMAVDANVLIYERMREEQANGRGPALAIDAGFAKALVTIIDSHVTQIGVALILFWFGHGPVRGFAWTLSIGVVTSVITATLVTQFFIAIWFRLVRPKQLPI
jgi:protein-export membrane protein SecD